MVHHRRLRDHLPHAVHPDAQHGRLQAQGHHVGVVPDDENGRIQKDLLELDLRFRIMNITIIMKTGSLTIINLCSDRRNSQHQFLTVSKSPFRY